MRRRVESAVHTIKEEIFGVLIFVAVVWGVFLIDCLPYVSLNDWLALRPRELVGLAGIVTMPLVHGGWLHIISNTIPLIVLMTMLAGSRAQSWKIMASIIVLGGLLTWVVGSQGKHVGASGLVFGLVTFLISSGFFEKRVVPIAIALLVGLLYGTSLIRGLVPVFPSGNEHISWAGHWCGAVAGVAVAYMLTLDGVKHHMEPRRATI